MEHFCAIILAAGKGTRMGKGAPKVLRDLLGKPLLYWTISTLKQTGIRETIVVTGYKSDLVQNTLKKMGLGVKFARQKRQLGTAHSLKAGLKVVPKEYRQVLVLFGDDSALYRPRTLVGFMKYHLNHANFVTLLTHETKDKLDIGGLKRDIDGKIVGVLTRQQIFNQGLKRVEILCGAFCFRKSWIEKVLPKIKKSQKSREYPLPGLIYVANEIGDTVDSFALLDPNEWVSVNSHQELILAERKKRGRRIYDK